MPSYYDLTDACQSDISKLSKLLGKQKDIMAKEELVMKDMDDTYLCIRAKTILENSERKLKEIETKYEYDLQKLKDKHDSDVAQLKDLIKSKEEMIDQQTGNKKTRTYKNAEAEATILQGKIDAMKENTNNYRNIPQAPPKKSEAPKISEPTPEPTPEPSPEPADILSYKEMMALEEREPKLTFLTHTSQYQSERQSKLPLSMREDMPFLSQKLDSTIYGPVSTLPPRPKIGVKVVPKRVINANTNVYPDTVLE